LTGSAGEEEGRGHFEWGWDLRLLLCSAATVALIATGCSSFEHAVAKHRQPRDRLTARDAAEAKKHAPPASRNAEVTGGYWITCKPGFVADSRRGGCAEGAPGNPTYVVEIPNSSGRWGATGSDDDDDDLRRDDSGGCCSSHGGIESIAGGSVICRDGRVDSSCSF
jgi:hypothetical protein